MSGIFTIGNHADRLHRESFERIKRNKNARVTVALFRNNMMRNNGDYANSLTTNVPLRTFLDSHTWNRKNKDHGYNVIMLMCENFVILLLILYLFSYLKK